MLVLTMGGCCRRSDTHAPTVANVGSGAAAAVTEDGAPADETKPDADAVWIREHFEKREVLIPMRDGVSLFTAIYVPTERDGALPILMKRTPYSSRPYGTDIFPESLGPSPSMLRDGYIFVYQDVRGRFMSEGEFVNMTPHHDKVGDNADGHLVDESTDTHDTITWLLEHVEGHNGRVGQWGISYPGFYAAAGMIDHHPALVAVSPQAPIADWWYDDFHHHGAFFLPHAFNFLVRFGKPRPEPVREWGPRFDHGSVDGYGWFLELGAIANATEKYMKDVAFWNDVVEHPNRDGYWQARDLLPHLHDVAPAVLTVGGWFDAEDLYGPLQIYRSIEKKNPDVFNVLVMGPWRHGGWSRTDGDHLGNVSFGGKHSRFYETEIERRFFDHYLRGGAVDTGDVDLPEASVFETGANTWRSFDQWPPAGLTPTTYYMGQDRSLSTVKPKAIAKSDPYVEWVSDPDRPVPFTEDIDIGMTREYMTDDQRFASRRPDVVTFSTEVLERDVTFAGPIDVSLWVSTSREDADFVVKLIDVLPDDAQDHEFVAAGQHLGAYQMMVRSEVFRGRFREGAHKAVPFEPNKPTEVEFPLQDVLHTFRRGHKIMIQVQSTWFPLVDRNPQAWVDNIYRAEDDDFASAIHRVYFDPRHPSRIRVGRLTD